MAETVALEVILLYCSVTDLNEYLDKRIAPAKLSVYKELEQKYRAVCTKCVVTQHVSITTGLCPKCTRRTQVSDALTRLHQAETAFMGKSKVEPPTESKEQAKRDLRLKKMFRDEFDDLYGIFDLSSDSDG